MPGNYAYFIITHRGRDMMLLVAGHGEFVRHSSGAQYVIDRQSQNASSGLLSLARTGLTGWLMWSSYM